MKKKRNNIEGVFVLITDVGSLLPPRAKVFVEKMKKNLAELEIKFPNWRLLAIPSQQMHKLSSVKLTSKGVLVFYINVGSLSPSAAEAFIAHIKEDHPWLSELDEIGVAKVFIPIRGDTQTGVDYLNLENDEKKQVI